MWRWHDSEVEGIPDFPHSISPHGHLNSRPHAYSSVPGSGSRGRSFDILHSATDCIHCHAYKTHVIRASLQDDALERDWNPGHTENIPGRCFSTDCNVSYELSQVRIDLRRVRRERNDAVALNTHYQNEVALLERQLQEAKDRLLAIEVAYGDEMRLSNTDLPEEEIRSEEVEQNDDFENNLSQADDSLDSDPGADGILAVEHSVTQAADFLDASWNDSSDDFDLLQQLLHLMIQEENGSPSGYSSSDSLQNESPPNEPFSSLPPTNSTLPTYSTDSSSDSPSPSSSLLSGSDWAGNQSDDSSSPSTSLDEEFQNTLKLMASAHEEGNSTALAKIKELIVQAERTPRQNRTKTQKYVLLNWRSPSSSFRNSPLNKTSANHQTAPPVYPLSSSSKGLEIFVDASAWGIGFVFKTQWLAWTFKRTCKIPLGKDGHVVMSWAELLAVEVGLRTLIAAGYRSTTITVRSDNSGVIEALVKKSWCQRHGIEEVLQNILHLCGAYGIHLRPSWISTKMNPADKPSRGVLPPWSLVFRFPPSLPENLLDLLELAAP